MKFLIFFFSVVISFSAQSQTAVKCEKITLYKRSNLNAKTATPITGYLHKNVSFSGPKGFSFTKKSKFQGLEAIPTEVESIGHISLENSKTGKRQTINKYWVIFEISAAEAISRPGEERAFGKHILQLETICTETSNH